MTIQGTTQSVRESPPLPRVTKGCPDTGFQIRAVLSMDEVRRTYFGAAPSPVAAVVDGAASQARDTIGPVCPTRVMRWPSESGPRPQIQTTKNGLLGRSTAAASRVLSGEKAQRERWM